MNIRKWSPMYAPEVETGVPEGTAQVPDQPAPPPKVPNNQTPVDGPGSGRNAIRQSLEKAAKEVREQDEAKPKPKPKAKPAGGYQSRAAEMRGEEEPAAEAAEEPAEQAEAPKEEVPASFGKDLKTSWGEVPEPWRQAIVKREQDMARGVEAIRAQYSEIDQVLGPRAELIKRHGQTPAQAVNQLFSWFDALAGDPDRIKQGQPPVAFIHLARSFGLDKLIEQAMQQGQPGQQQQPAGVQGGQPPGEIPPAVQQYISGLEGKLAQTMQLISQKFDGFDTALNQTRMEKTNEILAHWSQGKDHFEDVRPMMAHLLQSGAVPPLEGGHADLDKAYEMAIYAVPEVRQKVLTAMEAKRAADLKAKQDAEKKAQQEQADKARRAGVGLAPGAPGLAGDTAQGKGGKKKSVRESLLDSINELSQ